MLQDLALCPDSVDVSMAALASLWAGDPCDLGDRQHEPLSVWESQCVVNGSPPAGLMWTEQLSPHLHRNKQLQDTLLQREEELARLQEENSKLRQFLNSFFVRNLEEKAKKLTADGRRKLKRNLAYIHDDHLQSCGQQPVASQHVSKRVCRNLTAEFSSDSCETSAFSEPNLDLWVLRTLGLKDRDTIDTSNESSSSSGYNLRSVVYDTAGSISCEYTLSSSFRPSVATSIPSSVHSYCQSATHQAEYRYNSVQCHEANCGNPAQSPQDCTTSPGQYEGPDTGIRTYNTFQSAPVTKEVPLAQSPDSAEICSITASSQAQTLQGNPGEQSVYWSSVQGGRTPSQDTNQFSPPKEKVSFSPISCASPVTNQPWTPVRALKLKSPSNGAQPPATPQTPHSQTDLAFSMSLSPSSRVKTHSFPQGQAFIRKDTEGRWNFTWVPRQGP
uniref:Geminin coiled-coil domain containing n=1 Tax=Monopterus albus TaxID=43700 RepID=A0A3Q3K707_MONAL|nr:geminin coiled-coil domain-containing protein 1 [Monopterus albus]XP_020478383.1 geminin coiled-coil domain-containing protein 1 [Monopterus albus]